MKGKSLLGEYVFCPVTNLFHFENGVTYTLSQAMTIAHLGINTQELSRIHNALEVFDGELLEIMDGIKLVKCLICRGRGTRYIRKFHTRVECTRCNGKGEFEE